MTRRPSDKLSRRLGRRATTLIPFYHRRGARRYGRRESIFAFPTESFYALGVKATDDKAIRQLFRVKHRGQGKPVALIAADLKQVKKFFVMSKADEELAKQYWPGALTILMKPKKGIAAGALLGRTTPSPSYDRRGNVVRRYSIKIGVRVPAHAGARRLAARAAAPITATSANISGQPPTKSRRKLKQDFPDILIAPGRCGNARQPSTVVEIVQQKLIIHRQGAVHV